MWIEYHTALRDHWKIHRLSTKLSTDYVTALGAISCLWLWCTEYAADGNINKFTDDEIRQAARVTLEKFSKSTLLQCELMDGRGRINDWHKHGIKLLESRRKRQREYAERKRKSLRRSDVESTPTIPYLTIPNHKEAKSRAKLDYDYLLKDNINNLMKSFGDKESVNCHLKGMGFYEVRIMEAFKKAGIK